MDFNTTVCKVRSYCYIGLLETARKGHNCWDSSIAACMYRTAENSTCCFTITGNFKFCPQIMILFLPRMLVKITKLLVSHLGYVAICNLCYPAIQTLAISFNLNFSAAIQAQTNSQSFNQLQWYFIPTP